MSGRQEPAEQCVPRREPGNKLEICQTLAKWQNALVTGLCLETGCLEAPASHRVGRQEPAE